MSAANLQFKLFLFQSMTKGRFVDTLSVYIPLLF